MREFLIIGFGAGWSTWNSPTDFFLFDEGLIQLAKDKASETKVKQYLKEKGVDGYTGGWEDVVVETLGDDDKFIVEEYDGSESIRVKESEAWL